MTDRPLTRQTLGFDAFGAAVGVAVISGALAVVVPFLTVLTGTLAALAIAAWATDRHGLPVGRRLFRHPAGGWIAVFVAGAGFLYLDPPTTYVPYRSLGLALVLVLFWTEEQGRSPRAPSEAP